MITKKEAAAARKRLKEKPARSTTVETILECIADIRLGRKRGDDKLIEAALHRLTSLARTLEILDADQ